MKTIHSSLYWELSNFTLGRLLKAEKIIERVHPTENLRIFKYHPGFDFFARDVDTAWVELCRGLVWDWDKEEIVANPMPKFHNHFRYNKGDLRTLFLQCQYTVETKWDGSCALLWHYNDQWHWSTLGSFQSDQAKIAKEIFEIKCEGYNVYNTLNPKFTYIFEVFYPENRIVLDYGITSGIVHITTRHKRTGEELRGRFFSPRIEKPVHARTPLGVLLSMVKRGTQKEGFVVKFFPDEISDPALSPYLGIDKNVTRIKFKTDWYFKHSRIKQVYSSRKLIPLLIAQEKGETQLSNDMREALKYLNIEPLVGYVDILCGWVHHRADIIKSSHIDRRNQANYINSMAVHPKIRAALFCALDRKIDKMRELVWKSFEGEEHDFGEAFRRQKVQLKP